MSTSHGIPRQQGVTCLLLIVPETPYNAKTPVFLGTKIIHEVMSSCKQNFGDLFLQKTSLDTPLYLTFRTTVVRNQEVRKNKDNIAIIRSAKPSVVILGPNQNINIREVADREINCHPTCVLVKKTEESTIPDFIDITPTVYTLNIRKWRNTCRYFKFNYKYTGNSTKVCAC